MNFLRDSDINYKLAGSVLFSDSPNDIDIFVYSYIDFNKLMEIKYTSNPKYHPTLIKKHIWDELEEYMTFYNFCFIQDQYGKIHHSQNFSISRNLKFNCKSLELFDQLDPIVEITNKFIKTGGYKIERNEIKRIIREFNSYQTRRITTNI